MTEQAPFPPETLRQYALLADGERGEVVGPQLRGNLPQAFVHALLLETARALVGPDGERPGFVRAHR